MPKIILQGHILVPESDLLTVQEALTIHIKLTQQEVGCLTFDVRQDQNNRNKFNIYEEFENRKAFEYHQLRVKASAWAGLTKNVTRHYQITESE